MHRLFVLLTVFLATSSYAGWQRIAQLNTPIGCCFFLDENNGFIGSGSYGANPVQLKIWATRDGGLTWLPCAVPSEVGQVTQISIDADGVGYASIFCQANPAMNLWRTTDGGFSWVNVSSGTQYGTGVGYRQSMLTTASWNTSGAGNNGVFFMEGTTRFISPGPAVSNSNEAWSAYGDAATRIWYQVKEMSRRLFVSTDQGLTWGTRYDFNTIQPTGHIDGADGTIYIQTYGAGILRSTDNGLTWRVIGGPSNYVDTRSFWVGGCNGRTVIAFGDNGEVWKTTDGGDGLFAVSNPITIQHLSIPQISACAVSKGIAKLIYKDCGEYVITSATIENDVSGVFSLQPVTLPDTLRTGDTLVLTVDFDPRGNPSSYNARIRIRGTQIVSGVYTSIDSLIRLNAIAVGAPPKLTSNLSVVNFPGISVCASAIDTVITLKNEGCDTLAITSGPTAVAAPFMVQTLPLPLQLPPDSSASFRITFKPDAAGAANASTRIRVVSQGQQQEVEILLSGIGISGEGILAIPDTLLEFGEISMCALDTLEGFVTNTGCDTLIVETAGQQGDLDFALATASFPVGAKLRPGDTIWFVITFSPINKGPRSGYLYVTFQNEHGAFPLQRGRIYYSANVTDGSRSIAQSLDAVDFGITDLCTELDTVMELSNTGCDTVIVSDVQLSGQGFQITGVNTPIVLPPKDTHSISITTVIDTAGGTPQSIASLSVISTAVNLLKPIELKRSYIYPRTFGTHLVIDTKEETAGGVVHIALIGENGLGNPASGVRSIDAMLTLNEDLLHYREAISPNVVSKNGNKITLSNTNELQSAGVNVLAELVYDVMLTLDSTTDIVLSNITLNSGDTSPCTARVLATGGESFSYHYVCADRVIQNFLKTNSIDITSIHPNPARKEVTIHIANISNAELQLEIYDALGKLVARADRHQLTNRNSLTLSTTSWSPGIYVVRIGGIARSFVVER